MVASSGNTVISGSTSSSPFQPMKRGGGSGQGKGRGLGLGLYIVDRIVHAHEGRVAVRSTVEEGTTFTVRLPRYAGVRGA